MLTLSGGLVVADGLVATGGLVVTGRVVAAGGLVVTGGVALAATDGMVSALSPESATVAVPPLVTLTSATPAPATRAGTTTAA
jgi:hypothetical protein